MSVTPPSPEPGGDTFAAIDLGSNSFHLLVVQERDGRIAVVDRVREMVRLAAGLDDQGRLTPEALARASACLHRFAERVRGLPAGQVRAVGTNTLRRARNAGAFLAVAEGLLGQRIDIISGHEEARLIYLGVAHSLEADDERRLVVDIGGGSTELIVGDRYTPVFLESLYMGCVGFTRRFFPDGRITAGRWEAAELAARQELEGLEATVAGLGWQSAIGASGTIQAVKSVVQGSGWCSDGITAPALARLRQRLIACERVDAIDLPGLSAERRPVFAGGVVVLSAIFEALGIERMRAASGALREGLIHDLLGRVHARDVREGTVEELMRRFTVDRQQAERVWATAEQLWAQVSAGWELADAEYGRLLRWAAWLHEIGMSISHAQHHKHAAYLLGNLDMPGFARGEQRRLAALVRAHRRKFPRQELEAFASGEAEALTRMAMVLRVAVLMNRARAAARPPVLVASARSRGLRLALPPGWLEAHPLTAADLEQEAAWLRPARLKLRYA